MLSGGVLAASFLAEQQDHRYSNIDCTVLVKQIFELRSAQAFFFAVAQQVQRAGRSAIQDNDCEESMCLYCYL